MKNIDRGETREEAFARAKHLLAQYPLLPDEELSELKSWFDVRASSYDVALISMQEATASGYAAFKKDHIDRFSLGDGLKFAAFWAVTIGAVLAIGFAGT